MAGSSSNNQTWWRLVIRTVVILAVAFAGASIASKAAFQETPPQPLVESQKFWQQETKATIENTTKVNKQKPDKENQGTTYPVADVQTNASAYLISDLESGHILATKNPHQKLPIASLTKLMTAVVAHESMDNNSNVTISDSAVATYGSSGGLTANTAPSLSTLYRPLLLSSSNDAARAIAEKKGVSRFRNLMNRKALAIGMKNTRFADASGLSAQNISTAADLSQLAHYIHNHNQFIFDITADAQQTVTTNHSGQRQYFNNNPIHTEPGFVGGKNGYTDLAQHTSLSVFEITKNNTTRLVVIVTLGSGQAGEDTKKLLSWVKSK